MWKLPDCINNLSERLEFRIRVLALAQKDSAVKSRTAEEWLHMEEFPVKSDETNAKQQGNSLAIPCAQFDIIHEKFCFELISTERRTKHFELWDRKCVNTELGWQFNDHSRRML